MTVLLARLTRELTSLEKLTSSTLHNQIEHLATWDNRLTEKVVGSIGTRVDSWLAYHPLLNWLIHHPGIGLSLALLAIVLIIRLLITIYRGVAHMIDRLWLAILRSPFWLVKLIFGWEIKPKTNHNSVGTTITNYEITNSPEQLEVIMERLEQIQQQQQQILQDLAALKQQGNDLELKPINLQHLKSLKSTLPPDSL